MIDDVLFYKRCAFGSKCMTGQLDLMILRGSTNDNIIQTVVEEFFDAAYELESSVIAVHKEKELKDWQIIGWAGGNSILRLVVNAKGNANLLPLLEEEFRKLAYRLARKLDLGTRFNPDRSLRFFY